MTRPGRGVVPLVPPLPAPNPVAPAKPSMFA